jgi:branched-chain amino acid transport system substrate-binding protein
VGTGGVDAVFVVGSPPANALGPIIERERKILIAIGASDPTIAVGKTYSFIHWVIPAVLGDALAAELAKRNLQKIGFVSAEASGTIADMDAAISSLKERGLIDRVVYTQTFSKDETDYRTAIQRLRQKQVDTIVAVLFPGALSSFAKQMRSANIRAELVGMETFEDEDEVEAAAGALNGAWYVNAADSTERFETEYKSWYGQHPGWGAANGYDALRLIAEAVSQGKRTSDEIRDSLRSVKNHTGAAGQYSASGDNRFTLPASIKKIEGAKFVTLRSGLEN